jgi:hypothetical protein
MALVSSFDRARSAAGEGLTRHAAFYGRTIAAVEGFQAPGSRNVTYVEAVDETAFKSMLIKAVQGVYN